MATDTAVLDTEPQDVHAGDDEVVPTPELDGLELNGGGQLSFVVGGKAPDSSSLRLTGGKIDVAGSFEKGETVSLSVRVTVGEVAFVDVKDGKTGQVVGCERRHRARIVQVARA